MAKIHTILRIACASTILAATSLCAQQQIPDPANLTGEHVAPQSPADTLPINHGAAELQQLLVKLRTRASMLFIVAHPDDEDGGFLTYESRGQGARVAMLTLTRGEGGQNLMSADFDDALGLIRTQELLGADRYMGVDQFFGTEIDFGFSKTKEETLDKWTHDRVLYDAVRVVRLYRPLVIASTFVGGPTDGHGHHQVSGEIAQEVFVAAADPKVFPEMGLPPWAPLKVYARVPFSRVSGNSMFDYATGKSVPVLFHNYVTGKDSAEPPVATVQIHEGDKSSLIGMDGETYIQFARRGLALQKTQIGSGNGRLAPSGEFNVGYTLMASRLNCAPNQKSGCPTLAKLAWVGGDKLPASEQSIFDGIDTSLSALVTLDPATAPLRPVLEGIDGHIVEAQHLFDPSNPQRTAPPLRLAFQAVDNTISLLEHAPIAGADVRFNLLHELRVKRVQLNNAIALALGISTDAELAQADADVLTEQTKIAADIHVKIPVAITLKSLDLTSQGSVIASAAQPFAADIAIRATLAHTLPATRPFFTAEPGQSVYKISDPALRNAPATPAPLVATLHLDFDGEPLEVQTVIKSHQTVPRAAVVVPAISIALSPASGIITPAGHSLTVSTVIDSHTSAASISAAIRAPGGWEVTPPQLQLTSQHPGERTAKPFTVQPKNYFAGQTYELTATASDASRNYQEGFRPVGYPGLTYTNLYTPATYRATAVDVTTAPDLKIAYLPGTGDPVPDFLPSLGVIPTVIAPSDLTPDKLKQFDAILLGVRAYAAQSSLAGDGSKPLVDYARNGGIVILQYMTARFGDAEAPYPISVPGDSSHNVVEEAEPVQVLVPNAPLLNWPNKITSADFDRWVEERGHGFAASWSADYQPLLETHDPGQDPQRGGLLVAPVGKGAYIYCALALYRQLPDGVPGAYRLLANLLSYAKNPQRK
jgi:LmbE family N-acetylglucosaminyl deacetylase